MTWLSAKTGKTGMESEEILLIEDEVISRKVIADTLTRAGYMVKTCEDGKQALDHLRQHRQHYRLIILDRLMPVMDGLEFLQKLQQESLLGKTAVIMLTAVKEHEAIFDALEAGVHEYLTKPVDPEQLLALVKEMLEANS